LAFPDPKHCRNSRYSYYRPYCKIYSTCVVKCLGEDELSLSKGDEIEVLSKDYKISGDEGWWTGKCGGKVGVFPCNFVAPCDLDFSNLSKEELKRFYPPHISWSELQVEAFKNITNSLKKIRRTRGTSTVVLWNRKYFLRFRFRLLTSYSSGSGSVSKTIKGSFNNIVGKHRYFLILIEAALLPRNLSSHLVIQFDYRTVPVPVPFPLPVSPRQKLRFRNTGKSTLKM
jgi:hypothetical protein